MNKNDLVASVADNAGLTKADAAKAVDGVFEAITDALKKNDDVRIVGFGTFSVRTRKPRPGRNPKTGERIKIPRRRYLVFHAGAGTIDPSEPDGADVVAQAKAALDGVICGEKNAF